MAKRRPDYANIERLEQELGIGWVRWPGFAYVREDCKMELPDGSVVPVREALQASVLMAQQDAS